MNTNTAGNLLPQIPEKSKERYWRKVEKRGPDECWPWKAGRDKDGYGIFRHLKQYRAHRFSWFLHFCAIPSQMLVCHTCDNPSCQNPKHLFLGTTLDNVTDKCKKGRHGCGRGDRHGTYTHPESKTFGIRNGAHIHPESIPRGQNRHNAKLTSSQVMEIRDMANKGILHREIAIIYSMNKRTIGDIVRRKTWAHIP